MNYGAEGLTLTTDGMERLCNRINRLEEENQELREKLRQMMLLDQARDGKIYNPNPFRGSR